MMDIVALLVILYSSIFLLLFIHRQRHTRKITRRATPPPGPRGLPFIGNLHQLHNSLQHHHLWNLSKQYGPLMSLRFGIKPILIVSSARMARQIMKTHDLNFASRPSLLAHQKLTYNGLDIAFTHYSQYWREMKKLCVIHFFNSRRVQTFSPIREDEVGRMITNISQSAASHTIINLSEISLSFTSTLICRIAFGKRYEEDYGNERSKFHGLVNEAQAMLAEFYFSDFIPWLGWVDKLTGLHWRLNQIFQKLDMFYQQVINDHLNPTTPHDQSHQQQDIIDIFLRLIDSHSIPFDLTMDHIKALLMNIFLAGTDTSAAAIVWAMTSLIKNPGVMKKAQDEIRSVYGEKDLIREEDLQRLPYLKAIVKETLRLFPPTPLLLPRESMEKCNIEGYEIQAKTLVFVNVWAIGRDPETWEDAEEFNPERFLKCSIDFKGQDFELIPFGAGRRMCPGIQMGVVAVELALANLVHSFDWDLPEGVHRHDIDTQIKPGITPHKKNDLCLVAHNHTKTR